MAVTYVLVDADKFVAELCEPCAGIGDDWDGLPCTHCNGSGIARYATMSDDERDRVDEKIAKLLCIQKQELRMLIEAHRMAMRR